ncbi:MAG: transferase [Rhodoferax sp.]|nr:transferase [Rhodoferax sp.]MDP3651647.1 transferase [Rhodoferax sp.]
MNTPLNEAPDTAQTRHVPPFVYEEADSKSLHFVIHQLQSRMRTSRPNELQVDYTRSMMGFLLLNRHPRHIVMVGLGGGSLAKYCYQHLPQTRFTAVEINPHVIALRKEFLIPEDCARFAVVQADGADFVREAQGSIDVLLVDGYDHQGQPPQLCSLAFYTACRQALAAQGVLAVNLDDTHPLYELFVARLGQVFEGNIAEVAVNTYGNVIVFASVDVAISPLGLRSDIQKHGADWAQWSLQNA